MQIGQTVRGHVSNFNSTYKIYEIYVNSNDLDLYIDVTPCNGRVGFYVSDDYMSLFKDLNKRQEGGFIDLVT